jgi:hypothetical protein
MKAHHFGQSTKRLPEHVSKTKHPLTRSMIKRGQL